MRKYNFGEPSAEMRALLVQWIKDNGVDPKDVAAEPFEIDDEGRLILRTFVVDGEGRKVLHRCCCDPKAEVHVAKVTRVVPLLVDVPDKFEPWLVA